MNGAQFSEKMAQYINAKIAKSHNGRIAGQI